MATSLPPPVGDQLTPIQALIAGVQTSPRPIETATEQASVIAVYLFVRVSRGSWGPVDILVAATVLAAYSVFRVPV